VKPLGELQPLPIIPTIWTNISMDFIVGLLKSSNKSFIMVLVDHLSNYAYFYGVQHPFKASMIAQVFMDNIFKLHGMLQYILMVHHPTFTSHL
jgi:hypothetical protein